MLHKSNLPDQITLPCGAVLRPCIGGHLAQQPFLTVADAGVDVRQNGWASGLRRSEDAEIIAQAKRLKLKYRRVSVLSRNLRGRLDLHQRPYTGTQWVFVEVKP
jgi:hypothetical protein